MVQIDMDPPDVSPSVEEIHIYIWNNSEAASFIVPLRANQTTYMTQHAKPTKTLNAIRRWHARILEELALRPRNKPVARHAPAMQG